LSSSLLFALIHGHLAVLPALMLFSVLLTLAYERSGCLWVPTLMHAIFNAINIGLMVLFPQS
jgi:membrane protease YdiL (CAAX protease family)